MGNIAVQLEGKEACMW